MRQISCDPSLVGTGPNETDRKRPRRGSDVPEVLYHFLYSVPLIKSHFLSASQSHLTQFL